MKLIGLTQRVEKVDHYDEHRDCLDQNWGKFLNTLKYSPIPIPNTTENVEQFLKHNNIKRVLLTGGNDISNHLNAKNTSSLRDGLEESILRFCVQETIPVIGVCRGMQMINKYFGGNLRTVDRHIRCRHKIKYSNWWGDKFDLPKKVNSYHRMGIGYSDLAEELESVILAEDDTIECLKHKILPIYGIMWHPEREFPFLNSDINIFKYLFD